MKIEAGKTYKTRDGSRALVIKDDARNCLPVVAVIDRVLYDLVECFTVDGLHSLSDSEPYSNLDLVEEWREPLVLYAVIDKYGHWHDTTNDKISAQALCDAEAHGGKVVKLVEVQE